jgi:dolichol kinase
MASILYLNLGDLAAAMIGMSYGKSKLFGTRKSLEGTLACFFTCVIIGVGIFQSVELCEYIIFVGAISATLAELIPFIDDNVTIPLISGVCITLAANRIGVTLPPIIKSY